MIRSLKFRPLRWSRTKRTLSHTACNIVRNIATAANHTNTSAFTSLDNLCVLVCMSVAHVHLDYLVSHRVFAGTQPCTHGLLCTGGVLCAKYGNAFIGPSAVGSSGTLQCKHGVVVRGWVFVYSL